MRTEPGEIPVQAGHKLRRRALAILMVCGAAGGLSQFLRSSHTVIAPEIMRDLALSPEAFGVMTSAFFLAYGAAQIPVGVLLDRFGPRASMAGLLSLAVLGAALFGAADSAGATVAGRGLMGLGCAAIFMGAFHACSRWFPADRFSMVASIISALGYFGGLFAATPMAFAAEVLGWRMAFLAIATVTAAIAALLFTVIRDAPPGHPAATRPQEPLATALVGVIAVLKNRDLHYVIAIALVSYATIATVLSLWAGRYLYDVHGLTGVDRGNALLVMSAAPMAGSLLYGSMDRVLNTRKGLVLAGATVTTALLALLALLPAPGLILAVSLLSLLSATGSYGILVVAHGRGLFPDHLTGRAITTVNLGFFIGVSIVQPLSGVIVGAFAATATGAPPEAYRAVFAFLALVTIAAALVYARARDVKPRDT